MITEQPVNNHDDLMNVLDAMLAEVGLDRSDTGGTVTFAGMDPIRQTVLKVGVASAVVAAANAIAEAIIWKMRTGEGQDIHVDLRKAYVLQSSWNKDLAHCSMINGVSSMSFMTDNQSVYPVGFYATKDNRWVLLCAPYPQMAPKLSTILNCGVLPHQVEAEIMKWNAEELEAAAQAAGVSIHMCRTREEFSKTDQYKHCITTPLIHIEKIGDSKPEPFGPAKRPLSDVRSLSMVHVLAGPTVPRQLAAQGADCLNVQPFGYTEILGIYVESNAGLRQAFLDARQPENRPKVYRLIKEADVFVENLRPGEAAAQGLSATELSSYRPGLIYVTNKLMTQTGPWANWVGFDFSSAAISGICTETGSPDRPMLANDVNVIHDYITGYMGSLGIKAALIRRAKEGGSYRISTSLIQTAMFMQSLGLVDKNTLLDIDKLGDEHKPQPPDVVTGPTPLGEYTRLGSQVEMSKTPQYWEDPMIYPIGACKPEWLPR